MKASASAGWSLATPTKTTSAWAPAKADRSGASMLQGPHHEPKKLMTTGLPRSAARVKAAPPVVVALKALGVDALSRAVEYAQAAKTIAAATTMIVTSRLLPTVDLARSLLTHASCPLRI